MLCSSRLFSIQMDANGRMIRLTLSEGGEFTSPEPLPFACLSRAGKCWEAVSADRDGSRLTVGFADGSSALFSVREEPECLIFTLCSCPDCGEIRFCRALFPGAPLMSLGLNPYTTGAEVAGADGRTEAAAYAKTGLVGASCALVSACGCDALRAALKAVTEKYTQDIPYSRLGGAFAADPENDVLRRSYLLNTDGIGEDEVDRWIALARTLGARQIDFHGGSTFRFGDFRFDPVKYPEGRASMKRVIDRLHAAGIQAGLHTYAQFVSPLSEFVSPKPHPELACERFTLRRGLSEADSVLEVCESTEGVTPVTGFFVQNSAHLAVDDEIVRFDRVADGSFALAARGEFGTVPAQHAAGTQVRHLMQQFGLFVPDGDSELYLEVARRTAEVYNDCGFDMLYLDAIDGTSASTLYHRDEYDLTWYYANRFVSELLRSTKRQPLVEMSAMWHHFWYYRSRMGAWDHSTRAHKCLLREHDASNRRNRAKTFLPQNFGWWCFENADSAEPVETERMFLDDYEYLASRAYLSDWSLSYILSLSAYEKNALCRRAAELIGRYERMRLERTEVRNDPEPREPNGELFMKESGALVPVVYHSAHETASEAPLRFPAEAGQRPLLLRIENRPFLTEGGARTLLGCQEWRELSVFASKSMEVSLSDGFDADAGREFMRVRAAQHGVLGCVRLEKRFPAGLNLSGMFGLGLWVCGDGSGAKLDVQLISPKAKNSGTCDRVIRVDFTGWRYVRLIESGAALLYEDIWPFSAGGHYNPPERHSEFDIRSDLPVSQYEWHPSRQDASLYTLLRERVLWDDIESVSLLLGGVSDGGGCDIRLGDITAFRTAYTDVTDPVVCVNGSRFPIRGTLPPLGFFEYRDGVCAAYDKNGEELPGVSASGLDEILLRADNAVYTESGGRLAVTVGV